MLDYGDGIPTTENTLLEIIDALKYQLADQNIRIDLLAHLLAQTAVMQLLPVPGCGSGNPKVIGE